MSNFLAYLGLAALLAGVLVINQARNPLLANLGLALAGLAIASLVIHAILSIFLAAS